MPNCCQLLEMLNIVWDVVRVFGRARARYFTSSRLSSNRIGETRFSRQREPALARVAVGHDDDDGDGGGDVADPTFSFVVPLSAEQDEEAALRSLHLARDRPSYATPAIEPFGKSSSHRLDHHVWTVAKYRCLCAVGFITSRSSYFYLHLLKDLNVFVQWRENDGTLCERFAAES